MARAARSSAAASAARTRCDRRRGSRAGAGGLVRPELGADGLGGGAGQGGKGVRGSSSLSNVYSGEDNLDVLIA